MIVYGNLERLELAADVQASVARALQRFCRTPAGVDRHAALVSAFVRAAELVQGISDAEFEAVGSDARSPVRDSGEVLLLAMAAAVDLSWKSGFMIKMDLRPLWLLLSEVWREGSIRTRVGEGYAHYGLYPESYLETARRSGLTSSTCVIGIRSIGVGLGALVAAALDAAPALSLRPVGHPFHRQIRAGPDFIGNKVADPSIHFAIVDEGPGLSGSSFVSVARWLLDQGVTTERIHFFPSHQGQPGLSASTEIRKIWNEVTRHPALGDDIVLHSGGLRKWVVEKIGPIEGELRDLTYNQDTTGSFPLPQDRRFARRKLIAHNGEGSWLIKFAGIGDLGVRKFRDAQAIANAGLGPAVAGLCHGFLVQRWVEGEYLTKSGIDRSELVQALGSYLGFRTRHLGEPGPGASLDELRAMAVHNTAQTLGDEASVILGRRLTSLTSLVGRVHRIRTDNRLHVWEWLVNAQGILKLDAVDHCEGHDLIGCQDIAWDVAGAVVEHNLSEDELTKLCQTVSASGGLPVDSELAALLLPCYLAFQLGLWSTATPLDTGAAVLAASYADKLSRWLGIQS